jgi:SagB-type dehydrogenase family enzyme
MNRYVSSFIIISFISLLISFNFFCRGEREKANMKNSDSELIELPSPNHYGKTSVEEALYKRRSIRDYSDMPLTIPEISQLLWAAQGITEKSYGLRTAPSAGALYPLEIYIAVSNARDLSPGLYKYSPRNHTLRKVGEGDKRDDISNAALKQDAIENSSAIILITAVYERTAVKYGNRAERYVHVEVGAAGQNIYLQSLSLNIGTVMIGAFRDKDLQNVLSLPENEKPLAIMPLGRI